MSCVNQTKGIGLFNKQMSLCLHKLVSFFNYSFLLILVSVVVVAVVYVYEYCAVSLRYQDELRLAEENKVINELLIKFQEGKNESEFFYDYFEPITNIGVLKTLQFVSDTNGQIMHSELAANVNGEKFDFRKRDWYQCAKLLVLTSDFCISDPYKDYWPPHRTTITYSYPIYSDAKLLGVGLHDIYIGNLYERLFIIEFQSVSSEGRLISKINILSAFALFLFSYTIFLLASKAFSGFKLSASNCLFKDELTGLPTRRSFKHFPFSSSIKAICIIDIDFFKQINDTYGHDAGDRCLSEVSILMKSNIRKTDSLYRWGGEEFLLIISDDDVECVLERLRTEIGNNKFKSVSRSVTVTIGFCRYKYGNNVIDIIKRADRALYTGKNEGRNRVVEYY